MASSPSASTERAVKLTLRGDVGVCFSFALWLFALFVLTLVTQVGKTCLMSRLVTGRFPGYDDYLSTCMLVTHCFSFLPTQQKSQYRY
jgi:hypothetical protein